MSDLAEPTTTNRNSPDLENPATRPVGQVRRKSRASTLQKMAKKASPKDKEKGFPRKVSREAGNEVEVVVHDSASQDEGEFSDKMTSPVIGGADEGDWERTKREATCLAARMNWSFVEFDSWFARFIHVSSSRSLADDHSRTRLIRFASFASSSFTLSPSLPISPRRSSSISASSTSSFKSHSSPLSLPPIPPSRSLPVAQSFQFPTWQKVQDGGSP